jgi:hypothetical protein
MYLSGRNEKMSKMTAAERKEAKEWSEASERIRTREGWKTYQNARLAGSSHYDALDLAFQADITVPA